MIKKLSLPFQLLLVLTTVIFLGNFFNQFTIQFFYTVSLFLKELLSFLLPCIVFAFITTGILSFKKNAPAALGILLLSIMTSNALTAFFSYFIGTILLPSLACKIDISAVSTITKIEPLYKIVLPTLLKTDQAMLAAIITGVSLSFYPSSSLKNFIFSLKDFIIGIINRIFIPILPLYIFGFILEIHHQGIFFTLMQTYGKTFGLIFIMQMMVIFIMYVIAANFNLKKTIDYINIALPSYLTAFGTMSSVATIPITVQSAQTNTNNKALSAMAIPILANIHLLGNAITTPLLSLATYFVFKSVMPTITIYSTFVCYFCINMLAASGVPGGGIIIMIPILKSILNFDDTMITIMTTIYLLQESLITAANVMGDGALIIIINNILKRLKIN